MCFFFYSHVRKSCSFNFYSDLCSKVIYSKKPDYTIKNGPHTTVFYPLILLYFPSQYLSLPKSIYLFTVHLPYQNEVPQKYKVLFTTLSPESTKSTTVHVLISVNELICHYWYHRLYQMTRQTIFALCIP